MITKLLTYAITLPLLAIITPTAHSKRSISTTHSQSNSTTASPKNHQKAAKHPLISSQLTPTLSPHTLQPYPAPPKITPPPTCQDPQSPIQRQILASQLANSRTTGLQQLQDDEIQSRFVRLTKQPPSLVMQAGESRLLLITYYVKLIQGSTTNIPCNYSISLNYTLPVVKTEGNYTAIFVTAENIKALNSPTIKALIVVSDERTTYPEFELHIQTQYFVGVNTINSVDFYAKHNDFRFPENTSYHLPIDQYIFGTRPNVSITLAKGNQSTIKSVNISKRLNWTYFELTQGVSNMLSQVSSLDVGGFKVVTKKYAFYMYQDMFDPENHALLQVFQFSHRYMSIKQVYVARIAKITMLNWFKHSDDSFFIAGITVGMNPQTVFYYIEKKEDSSDNNPQFVLRQSNMPYPLQAVSNIQASDSSLKVILFGLTKPPEITKEMDNTQRLVPLVISFLPFTVTEQIVPHKEPYQIKSLAYKVNNLSRSAAQLTVNVSKFYCTDFLAFKSASSIYIAQRWLWLDCVDSGGSAPQNIILKLNMNLSIYAAVQAKRSLTVDKPFKCHRNKGAVFMSDRMDGIYMKGHYPEDLLLMSKDELREGFDPNADVQFYYQCIPDSLVILIIGTQMQGYKTKIMLVKAYMDWASSRVMDSRFIINGDSDYVDFMQKPMILPFLDKFDGMLYIYTNMVVDFDSEETGKSSYSSSTKKLTRMVYDMKYPRITFESTVPATEQLTVYPYNRGTSKGNVSYNVTLNILPERKINVEKKFNVSGLLTLFVGDYDFSKLLNITGPMQSIYIRNRPHEIHIQRRHEFLHGDMEIVNNAFDFYLDSDYLFAINNLKGSISRFKQPGNLKTATTKLLYQYSKPEVDFKYMSNALNIKNETVRCYILALHQGVDIRISFFRVTDLPNYDFELKTWEISLYVNLNAIDKLKAEVDFVKMVHTTNKNFADSDGSVYIASGDIVYCYSYEIFMAEFSYTLIDVIEKRVFDDTDERYFLDLDVISYNDRIPHVYESGVYTLMPNWLIYKQTHIDVSIKSSKYTRDYKKFRLPDLASFLSCHMQNVTKDSVYDRCLMACSRLFVYTVEIKRKLTKTTDKDMLDDFGQRVLIEEGFIENMETYIIPTGLSTKSIQEGFGYFAVLTEVDKYRTKELLIFKKGTYDVHTSLYLPYEMKLKYYLVYYKHNNTELLYVQEDHQRLTVYALGEMKLIIGPGYRGNGSEKFDVMVQSFGSSGLFSALNFTVKYNRKSTINQVQRFYSLIVLACMGIGLFLIGYTTFLYLQSPVKERLGMRKAESFKTPKMIT